MHAEKKGSTYTIHIDTELIRIMKNKKI